MLTREETWRREDWQKGCRSLTAEYSYWIDEITGEIPGNLHGTLFRNGPGRFERGSQAYGHPFDGDGMVCAVSIAQGRAHFANSFVKTPEFLAEEAADRVLYRGVFGTQKAGGWLANLFDFKLKNLANTNVIYHGDKLLALWEAARPYRLDPGTLATLGIESFDEALASGQAFTAHPKLDPLTGDLWGFGVEAGPQSTIVLYRIDATGQLHQVGSRKIPGFCFMHDFAFTSNHCLFTQNPVRFRSLPFVLGLQPAATCIDLKPNTPTKILIFDREGNLTTLDTDPCFIFHHGNAYEREHEILLDSACYDDYPKLEPNTDYREVDFAKVVPAYYYRFQIDRRRGIVTKTQLCDRSCEFPVVDPRRVGQAYRYVYLGVTHAREGNAPLQAIAKCDVETKAQEIYSFAPQGFVSEPTFVPYGPAEDDGWLIVPVFDAARDRSQIAILDGRNIAAGPVATLHLKHHVPYSLHGNFTPHIWVE